MTTSPSPAKSWKRVVVKLSGEALMGDGQHGLDAPTLARIARDLATAAETGVEIAVVVGGGNFFRGIQGADKGIERARADSIGMLATVMNGLALEQAIEAQGRQARTLSSVPMPSICESYSRRAALHHLAKGRVVIAAGGTGNPFFTTDTAASLRAIEINAEILLKATKVNGIYDSDPNLNPDAKRYTHLTFDKVLNDRLNVMDATAIVMCRENNLPLQVFNLFNAGDLLRIVQGEDVGTVVSAGP
jgi:uridylate kinase